MKETRAAEELREFPEGASEWIDAPSRRRFLSLSAASLALAGIGACTRQPRETIVPYVDPPEEIVPGRPSYFATATHLRGIATGILLESHMGRPTKVEATPSTRRAGERPTSTARRRCSDSTIPTALRSW